MKPVLGSLGANTLVILTPEESKLLREVLQACPFAWDDSSKEARARLAIAAGILRGTAHLQAEFDSLQKAKKHGK